MNIPEFRRSLSGKLDTRFDVHGRYILTEEGKLRAEDYGAETGIRLHVLSFLDERGASKIREIARGLGVSENLVKDVLKRLIADGFVRPLHG